MQAFLLVMKKKRKKKIGVGASFSLVGKDVLVMASLIGMAVLDMVNSSFRASGRMAESQE